MDTTAVFYSVVTAAFSWFSFLSYSKNVSVNQSFLWISKNSPENDVRVWTDVFASIHSRDPRGPWFHTPLFKTVIRKFLKVPRVRFEHVINTIRTEGHDHFCAGLKKQTRRDSSEKMRHKMLNKLSKVIQLVSSKARVWTQAVWLQSPCSLCHTTSHYSWKGTAEKSQKLGLYIPSLQNASFHIYYHI